MIGKISGRIDIKSLDHVLVDTGGVGYVVYCSERTLAALPAEGEAASLYTDLVVREDLLQLYGFLSVAEREWHRLLTSVQGVGAKAALAIQGALGPEGVGRAIALGDAAAVRQAPGVGPKLATRVVNELKDKAASVMASAAASAPSKEFAVLDTGESGGASGAAQGAAISALVNLGYGQSEAATAVAEASGTAQSEADLIRLALKRLAPQG